MPFFIHSYPQRQLESINNTQSFDISTAAAASTLISKYWRSMMPFNCWRWCDREKKCKVEGLLILGKNVKLVPLLSISAWIPELIPVFGSQPTGDRKLWSSAITFHHYLTWRPSFPGHRSSSMECATAQCHLRTISVLIPATPEDIFFSSDNCVNNTNYCVVVLKCLALSTMLILANWTELNYNRKPYLIYRIVPRYNMHLQSYILSSTKRG